MRLRKLAKDGGSKIDGCQAVYLAEDGRLAVQGDLLDSDSQAHLDHVLPGEGAVFIKPEILSEALRRHQSGG